MGIKKIARPINKAKNEFVKWLKENDAEYVDIYNGTSKEWNYYIYVDGFIDEAHYSVYFKIWSDGLERIDYSGGTYKYENISVQEFLELIR